MSEDSSIPMRPKDLGELRTVMAADRTLMAWIRTALSMFSFGFTIYKLLNAMAESGQIAKSGIPRDVGILLASLGITSIVLGTISYWMTMRDLQAAGEFRMGRPVLLMALIMSVVGILMLVGIINKTI